jgi:hypothetical protein
MIAISMNGPFSDYGEMNTQFLDVRENSQHEQAADDLLEFAWLHFTVSLSLWVHSWISKQQSE